MVLVEYILTRFLGCWQTSQKLTQFGAFFLILGFSICNKLNANNSVSTSVVIDNNNKIVLGGSINNQSQDFLVVRYNQDGSYDLTFNPLGQQPGTVFTDFFGFTDGINDIAIDSKNKIIAAGFANNGTNSEIALARYNNNGSLDPTFNPNSSTPGLVTTNINGVGTTSIINGVTTTTTTGSNSVAYALAIDNNNKIVVVGSINNGQYTSVLVVRYNYDGSLDSTFNPTGATSGTPGILIITISKVDDQARGVTIDNNNRIVIAGFSNIGTSSNFLIIRLNPDGSPDTSFVPSFNETGSPAFIQISLNSSNSGSHVVINNQTNNTVMTTQNSGKLANSNNIVASNQSSDIAIDNNNKIVISGTTNNGNNSDFVVIRLNPDGSLDTTFNSMGTTSGVPGIVEQDISNGSDDTAKSLLIDNNNNIVVTGFSIIAIATNQVNQTGTNTVFATIRLLPNGILDPTFNGTGIVTTQLGSDTYLGMVNTRAQANSIVIDNNNHLVVTGFSFDGVQNNATTVRYLTSGLLDATFNNSLSFPGSVINQILGQGNTSFGIPLGYSEDNFLPTALRGISPRLLRRLSSLVAPIIVPRINAEDVNITNISAPFINGSAQPNSTVTAFVNDIPITSSKADVNGYWELQLPALTDGIHKIYVNSSDEFTSLTLSSRAVSLTIDTRRPFTPTITLPSNNSFVSTTTPIIKGMAKPNSHVAIFINNTLVYTAVADSQGIWSYSSKVLTEGHHQLYVISEDLAGNRSLRSKPVKFTVDTKAFKAPKIVTPTDKFVTKANKPIISGEARSNSKINIFLNDKLVGTTRSNARGGWSYSFKKPLEDGNYSLYASIDQAGGKSLSSTPIQFTVDTIPPKPAIITSVKNRNDLINGFAEPNSKITIYLDGNRFAQVKVDKTGKWGYTPRKSDNIKQGFHKISISVSDAAGNVSSLVEKKIEI